MKKLFAMALCAMTALLFSACGTGTAAGGSADAPGAQIANPFADYATLEEAVSAAGFPLSAPNRIDGYGEPLVQLMSGKMLQLIFRGEGGRIILRKAAGGDDISGDYNSYPETKTARINGADVTLKGADGKISTAVWCADGFSYAFVSDTPMAPDVMTDLIAEIA